jgi:hypothetical protein
VLTDLMFDHEGGPRRSPLSTRQHASESINLLCGLTRDQQQVGFKPTLKPHLWFPLNHSHLWCH